MRGNDARPPFGTSRVSRGIPPLRSFLTPIAMLMSVSVVMAQPVRAQVTPPGFGAFKHVRWSADDGAPGTTYKIAQTPDGYLWLAGDALFRFDGMTFERIEWPAGTPRSTWPAELMVSRDGELWVGLSNKGGVLAYRGGRLVDMRMPDPPSAIAAMAQAPDGTIWAASGRFDQELRRLRGKKWESVGKPLGLPAGAVIGLITTSAGGLWVSLTHQDGESGAIAYLAPHASRFREMPFRLGGRPKIVLDSGGALWASDGNGTRMLLDGEGKPPASPARFPPLANLRTAWPAFDRQGGIWGTTASVGIFYIPGAATSPGGAGRVYQFGAANGLTSDISYKPFVDREGSVWIATESGIDQFRRGSATQELAIPDDPVHGLSIASARDGSVYFRSRQSLFRAEAGKAPERILDLKMGEPTLCAARNDGIWVIEAARILRVAAERASLSLPNPSKEPITACAEDRLGRLWIALESGKLLRRDASGWRMADGAPAAGQVWDLIGTPWGDPAFSTRGSKVGIIRGDRLTIVDLAGSGIGVRSMIAAGTRDLFLSGDGGLIRMRDGRWQRLSEIRFPWLADLRSLVQTEDETWLIGRRSISRVVTADLDRAFGDHNAALKRTLFDAQDGLGSTTQHPGFTGPQSATGGDGRVWFLNRQGASFFEPAALERSPPAPAVAIRSVSSGAKSWRDPGKLVLPPGTRAVDILYAGLSLAAPTRITFRYRLEGVDEGWVDAGAGRRASYTNLSPGAYRFHVTAANGDGAWSSTGVVLEFQIRPTFVQGWPFKLLCSVALLGILSFAYAMRMRTVARHIRSRMTERIAERERIARELHDTLIQSVQGLILRLQLIAEDMSPGEAQRLPLERALDSADAVLGQARDRVLNLRAADRIEELEAALGALANDHQGSVPIDVFVNGRPRAVSQTVTDELIRIVGEALVNARAHAAADCVEIQIRFGWWRLSVSVVDGGRGIEPELLRNGGRPGHFGLAGMRERARAIHGRLEIDSKPGGGTNVRVTIPARIAYFPDWRRRVTHG